MDREERLMAQAANGVGLDPALVPQSTKERLLAQIVERQKGIEEDIETLDNTKASVPTIVSQSAPTAITIADNTEYTLTDVTALTFSYPASGSYAAWIRLTTAASGTVTITFPTSQYIPAVPTFGNSETWLMFVENGIVTAQKAVSAS